MSLPTLAPSRSKAIPVQPKPSPLWPFAMLVLTLVLAALDQTILSTALPVMARELPGGWPLAWVFSAYLLAATVVIALYGRLADLLGRKPMLLLAIGLFLLGSLACGASHDLRQLVLARALQGAGGGGLMTLAMLTVPELFAPDQRGRYQALMFVSAAAVAHFFAQADGDWPADVRCWATGPGTVAALRRVGIAEPAIDAPPADAPQFDSEALWDRVRDQVVPGAEVLVVRGGDAQGRPAGRDWLGDRIEAAGGRCSRLVAYRRLPPAFDGAQRRLAGDASKPPAVWLFSSAEAIGNLCRAMPDTAWREARAVATHWRIAQAAQGVGLDMVQRDWPGPE